MKADLVIGIEYQILLTAHLYSKITLIIVLVLKKFASLLLTLATFYITATNLLILHDMFVLTCKTKKCKHFKGHNRLECQLI